MCIVHIFQSDEYDELDLKHGYFAAALRYLLNATKIQEKSMYIYITNIIA